MRVRDAAVGIAVAAGDEGGAFRQLVFAALAAEDELVQSRPDHGHGRGELLEVDQPEAGIVA